MLARIETVIHPRPKFYAYLFYLMFPFTRNVFNNYVAAHGRRFFPGWILFLETLQDALSMLPKLET